jgi:TolA-binding protein
MPRYAERTIWLWTTGAAVLLLAFSLGALNMMEGDLGESLYRQAETLRQAHQHERALRHYRLLVNNHPRSAWADDALFRQGEILGNHLKRYRQAAAAYRGLVDRYPDSPRAGDALMAVGAIAYLDLQDYGIARAAYQEALEKFPTNRSLCADALLMLGRIQFDEGQTDAERFFVTLLKDYADNKNRCAEAQLYVARTYDKLKHNPTRAFTEYRKVMDNYPNTSEAEDAKRAAGTIYFEQANAAQQKTFLHLTTVASDEPDDFSEPALLRAVRACLAAQGIRADPARLMGLSGLAFQFVYSPQSPSGATALYLRDPLNTICEFYGVRYEYAVNAAFKDALMRLKQELMQRRPLLLYLAPSPGWVAVIGYEEETQRVSVQGRGMRAQTYSYKELERLWNAPPLPFETSAKGRYACYVFSQRAPQADRRRAARRALATSCRWMREERSGQWSLGFHAYDQMIAELKSAAQATEDAPQNVAALQSAFLSACESARTAAVLFLNQVSSEMRGEQRDRLLRAAEHYQQVAQLYRDLKSLASHMTALASFEPSTQSPQPNPPNRYEQAMLLFEQIRDLEEKAVEEMEATVK